MGRTQSLFSSSWSFSWSGYSGLYFWIILSRVRVRPSQAAWSGTMLSTGDWVDITRYPNFDLSSVLEAVHVFMKVQSRARLGRVMLSTLQMFTMLHVCKKYFSYAITDQSQCTLLWSSHVFYVYLFSLLLFFICSKLPILNCDFDLTLPTVWMSDEKHFNWTWHTNMNMKEIHIGNSNNIQSVKKYIMNIELSSGNAVRNK